MKNIFAAELTKKCQATVRHKDGTLVKCRKWAKHHGYCLHHAKVFYLTPAQTNKAGNLECEK